MAYKVLNLLSDGGVGGIEMLSLWFPVEVKK